MIGFIHTCNEKWVFFIALSSIIFRDFTLANGLLSTGSAGNFFHLFSFISPVSTEDNPSGDINVGNLLPHFDLNHNSLVKGFECVVNIGNL